MAILSNSLCTNDFLRHPLELGNANDFVDGIMGAVNNAVVVADLDPALLPETSLNLGVVSPMVEHFHVAWFHKPEFIVAYNICLECLEKRALNSLLCQKN